MNIRKPTYYLILILEWESIRYMNLTGILATLIVSILITCMVVYVHNFGVIDYLCLFFSIFPYTFPHLDASNVIIFLLASLNSCTNPWIYMIYTEGICSKLRGLVADNRMSGKRRKLSTFFTFDDRSRGTL